MSTTSIIKSVFFNAPRETVWEFLTDKDKLGIWYHPAESDLAEGQAYCLYRLDEAGEKVPQITGRVLEMKVPWRLVTTFVIGPFQGQKTTITWILEEAAGGTRLVLTHEGIAEVMGDGAMHLLMALDHGWDKHLGDLRSQTSS